MKARDYKANLFFVAAITTLVIVVAQWVPYIIFIAPAGLLALVETDPASGYKTIFYRSLFVFISLLIAFGLLAFINESHLAGAFDSAFAGTLAVITYLLFKKFNNNKLGQLTFLIIWMGFQYLLLKIAAEITPLFMADSFYKAISWTHYTGYLGMEVWIFWIGLNLYTAFLRTDRIVILSIIFAVAIFLGGILFASNIQADAISKDQMLELYINGTAELPYLERGEWMARTSAWVSVLLIILTFVRFKTRKA